MASRSGIVRSVGAAWAMMALAVGAGAVWVVASSASPPSVWFVLVVSVAGTAAIGLRGLRWARQLAHIERAARSMLDWSPDSLVRPPSPEAGPGGAPLRDDEFASLRSTVWDLGRRLSDQLKQLAKQKRNLESLIDALDEPVLATDDEERVLLCNRSAEALFAEKPGEIAGRPIESLLTQEDLLTMHGAARRGEIRRGRVKVTTPLGVRVFQVSAAPLPAAWGGGVFGVVLLLRDVTELDRADQIKTDFVANASHELRTPVAAIRGALETLLEVGDGDTAMRDKLVRMALNHAERLEEMTRDLLDLSRLEAADAEHRPGEDRPLDTSRIESSLRGMFEQACARRNLALEFSLATELDGVLVDPRLLMLALRNLVENASKFAYEGTTIRVSGRLLPGVAAGSGQGTSPALRIARFEVADKGMGVPLNLRERVFERYFQVDPARTGAGASTRGTGLGLSIVKHAIKVLGGEVGLESVYREGTTVWAEVPVGIARA